MTESNIQINGSALTIGQAMALRMAVSEAFSRLEVDPGAFGDDDHGRMMVSAYRSRLKEVLVHLMRGA